MIKRLRRLYRIREKVAQVAQAHYQRALANAANANESYQAWLETVEQRQLSATTVAELGLLTPRSQAHAAACTHADTLVVGCAADLRRVSAELERAKRMLERAVETQRRSQQRREQQAVDDFFGRGR